MFMLQDFLKELLIFDPSINTAELTSKGDYDVFVLKLDVNGDYLWAKSFGGSTYNDVGQSITIDNQGSIYITGWFSGIVDFDPSAKYC